jgi:hypothetical protein
MGTQALAIAKRPSLLVMLQLFSILLKMKPVMVLPMAIVEVRTPTKASMVTLGEALFAIRAKRPGLPIIAVTARNTPRPAPTRACSVSSKSVVLDVRCDISKKLGLLAVVPAGSPPRPWSSDGSVIASRPHGTDISRQNNDSTPSSYAA